MKYQAVFWDFDGVILDSVNVKTQAFGQMFAHFGPEVERAVVEYHLAHEGVSRYEKFRYFYTEILNSSITAEQLKVLGETFSNLTLERILAAPFIPGSLETLNLLRESRVPCYIVSGTPQDEIQYIVKARKLTHFFKEVHGSPRKKHEIVDDILERYEYREKECLFVGDAMADYVAAQKTKIPFLGILQRNRNSPFPSHTLTSSKVEIPAALF